MGKYTTTTYSLVGSTQKYSAPSSSTNIQFPERILGLFGLLIPLAAVSVITTGFGMGDVKLCAAFGWTLGAFTAYCALAAALFDLNDSQTELISSGQRGMALMKVGRQAAKVRFVLSDERLEMFGRGGGR